MDLAPSTRNVGLHAAELGVELFRASIIISGEPVQRQS